MSKSVCLVWQDDSELYASALAQSGIADRFELHCVKLAEAPPGDVIPRVEVLVGSKPGDYLSRMPKLRWIQATSAGVDSWLDSPDLGAAVDICCARGSHRLSMPENILGVLFHVTKPLMAVALAQKERRWVKRMLPTLSGRTLGILGLGAIGQELARKAAGLDMRVIGTKRTPAPLAHVEQVYPTGQTDEVLRQSDFVVILMPATPDTEDFMNADRLKAMKPTAWLLNLARGSLVVDADLIEAVQSKTIAGAVLDVFREEPLPAAHPFWSTEGILVLPHVGGGHPDRASLIAEIFADNARSFLAGKPLATAVDRARGY